MIDVDEETRACSKRYAGGKVFLFATAPASWASVAESALASAVTLRVDFDREQFRQRLREAGAPDSVVERCMATFKMIDETFMSAVLHG